MLAQINNTIITMRHNTEILNIDRMFNITVKLCLLHSVALLVMLSLAFPASAHVPLMAGGNENISTAMQFSDPGESWAVYGTLERDGVHYYCFDLLEGERIYLSLFKSSDAKERDFLPALALLGPGLNTDGLLPEQLASPTQASDLEILMAEDKNSANATYEPFSPSSFIEIAEINISAPRSARYYAAVYSNIGNSTNGPNGPLGHYGLAVGYREKSNFSERITTPMRIISVYLWEGQSLGLIFIPYIVAEIVALLFFWRGSRRTSFCLAGSLAGFLFLATSAAIFTQMVFNLTRAPFRVGGVPHSGHCRFPCAPRCDGHPPGQGRCGDTAKSTSSSPRNLRPADGLGNDHGSHSGSYSKLLVLEERKHLQQIHRKRSREKLAE